MKLQNCLLFLSILVNSFAAIAQQRTPISLEAGSLLLTPQQSEKALVQLNAKLEHANQPVQVLLQFEKIPTTANRNALVEHGIELLDYLPQNAYTALLRKPFSWQNLKELGIQQLAEPTARQKMEASLWQLVNDAGKSSNLVELWVQIPRQISLAAALPALKSFGQATVVFENPQVLAITLDTRRVVDLARHPFVGFVQSKPADPELLVSESRVASGAAVLQSATAFGGRGLQGEGVVIGVGDNGDVQTHIDFTGRLISRIAAGAAGHAMLTHGIVGGAGILQERNQGYAPKSTLVSQSFSSIINHAARYVADHGMVITNNSYGASPSCANFGVYNLLSALLDEQAFSLSGLQHVFSSGNSGTTNCGIYAPSFGTVLGGYQAAKNILTVGSTNAAGVIAGSSSKGPVKDGRLKPEIVAMGDGVPAPWPANTYRTDFGTSLSAPAVSGGLALLYQRFRQLHSGANPKSGLMKALVCNGASDLGNAGPDYRYGFGWLNLPRSLGMLENGRYLVDSLRQAQTKLHRITVPAGTAQLKVMLYWHDPAASPISGKALVHDLDLRVKQGSQTYLPLVLDTVAARVDVPAAPGIDRLNNIEQVIVQAPAAGTYEIEILGSTVAALPNQEYFVVYDFVSAGINLMAPAGGERFDTSETTRIHWEAPGSTGTVALQYATSDGGNWQTIATGIAAGSRMHSWRIPASALSEKVRVRVVAESTGMEAAGNPFAVIPVLKDFSLTPACEGYLVARWRKAAAVSAYEVLLLRGADWQTVGITTDSVFTLRGLSRDSAYTVTVRALLNGVPGLRSPALIRTPAGGNCAGSISDGDLRLDAIISPVSGRRFSTTALSAQTPVIIQIKNLDDAPVDGFTLQYSIDGGQSWERETVNRSIAAGATYQHGFSRPANLEAVGSYAFVAVVKNLQPDSTAQNDTAFARVRQIDNQPVNLNTAWIENFERSEEQVLVADSTGIAGLERFDFANGTAFGRMRTFVNSGMAHSGVKAITLDADRLLDVMNKNQLTATLNLSAYNTATDELRFDFRFRTRGALTPANRVLVRGSDRDAWIELYRLERPVTTTGLYRLSPSLELSDILIKNNQQFSASFQVQWEQEGILPSVDNDFAGGYSIDDIRLFKVAQDVALLRLDSIRKVGCSFGNQEALGVWLRNGTVKEVTNLPVRYAVNEDAWVEEIIPVLKGNDSLFYSFRKKMDLSAPGPYRIRVALNYPADEFRENDTLQTEVFNISEVSSFPYLQNFEQGAGGWLAEGTNVSWKLGTPVSPKINRAASGTQAWKTSLGGSYNDNEFSYLNSPCFQFGAMQRPTLSLMLALGFEQCAPAACDSAWVEYSADGKSWQKLNGNGIGWYPEGGSWHPADDTRWRVATVALPKGLSSLRLRFVLYTDAGVRAEGIAIDDVHVYDNTMGIYTGADTAPTATAMLSGQAGWVHFTKEGRLLASVNATALAPVETTAQTFIHPGNTRFIRDQYYHNRSLVLKPAARTGATPVKLRFYFTHAETQNMLEASGCLSCPPLRSVTDLGVTSFRSQDPSRENGSLEDNLVGLWDFVAAKNLVLVPFDAGYYAELEVLPGGEYWLNAGGLQKEQPLPIKFVQLTAQKLSDKEALLQWQVAGEAGVAHYEIEVARGAAALASNGYNTLGKLEATGGSGRLQYRFSDLELPKYGIRFYRVKVVNTDGSLQYSPVASLVFDRVQQWELFPNPGNGVFYLLYQLPQGSVQTLYVSDILGRNLKVYTIKGYGQTEKLTIDLSGAAFPPGLYLLHGPGGKGPVFRMLKE